MIELFLSHLMTLLHFLIYWTIYLIYITLCFIFELKLSLLEFLIPIIFELIYLGVNRILTIKLYLISQLFNLIQISFNIILQFITFITSIILQLNKSLSIGYIIIIFIIIIFILLINIQNQQLKRNNYSYTTRNSYQQYQTLSYSQNKRQQYQIQNTQIEEEKKKKLIQELNENREMIRLLYQNKVDMYQLKKNKEINKAVYKTTLEIYVQRIEILQEKGKELFLNLINIQDGICRVDFHNFYKAEIKALLDGIFNQIRLYKQRLGYRYVKLKIIVGKGNHSKNGIPVIGPLTQVYLKEYLQEEIEITNGFIEIQV